MRGRSIRRLGAEASDLAAQSLDMGLRLIQPAHDLRQLSAAVLAQMTQGDAAPVRYLGYERAILVGKGVGRGGATGSFRYYMLALCMPKRTLGK